MLSKKQLEYLEHRLQSERTKALKALGRFGRRTRLDREVMDSDLYSYTDHMADQGTETMEREKAALFASKEGRYIYRLERALRRLYSDPDNFGMCQTCGVEVALKRLDALPHARYCIECKRQEEAEI